MKIPLGAQYWKSSKSILPVAEEDGIVGLTFSPSGDSSLQMHGYDNKRGSSPSSSPPTPNGANRPNHVSRMNEFNSADAPAAFETKDGLFNMKAGNNSATNSSTASCSSSSSNAGDTSSSCGSTAASSVRASNKRRSRTFACSMPSAHRSLALIRKNFMQTFRNIGYSGSAACNAFVRLRRRCPSMN